MKPSAPIMMKAISQPSQSARRGIVSGAAKAPTELPALNNAVARALSFLGKYSAVVFMAAGKFPPSPMASTARHIRKSQTLMPATAEATAEPVSIAFRACIDSIPSIFMVSQPQPACMHAPTDQMPIAQRKPFFVPIQSTNLPANRQAKA